MKLQKATLATTISCQVKHTAGEKDRRSKKIGNKTGGMSPEIQSYTEESQTNL